MPPLTNNDTERADDDGEEGAFTVGEFTEKYGVGKNLVYDEIASGRLEAKKVGSRKTLIPKKSARAWLRSLPPVVLARSPEGVAA
jgi:excisionase family DNA binding protein